MAAQGSWFPELESYLPKGAVNVSGIQQAFCRRDCTLEKVRSCRVALMSYIIEIFSLTMLHSAEDASLGRADDIQHRFCDAQAVRYSQISIALTRTWTRRCRLASGELQRIERQDNDIVKRTDRSAITTHFQVA